MTLKRRSARAMMVLLVIMILAAFALLSLREIADGKFDFIALPFGALVCFYMAFSASMYSKAFRHFDRLTLYIAYFLIAIGLIILYRINTAYDGAGRLSGYADSYKIHKKYERLRQI